MALRKPIFISEQGYSQELDGYADSVQLSAMQIIDADGNQKIMLDGYSGNLQVGGTLTADGYADFNADLNVDGQVSFGAPGVKASVRGWLDIGEGFLAHQGSAVYGGFTATDSIELSSVGSPTHILGYVSIDDAMQVLGGVDLAASGIATNVHGTLNVDEETTLASAIISDLTQSRIVFAGANGALVDDASLVYDNQGSLTIGGNGDNGSITIQNGDGQNTFYAGPASMVLGDGANGDMLVAERPDSNLTKLSLKDHGGNSKFIFDSRSVGPSIATFNASLVVNGDISVSGQADLAATDVYTNVHGPLDVQQQADFHGQMFVTGATTLWNTLTVGSDADLNGALDVAGEVALADAGLATNVRGTLNVAEGSSFNGLADFNADVTANKISIDNDVPQRLYVVDSDGSMRDESELTFDGEKLSVAADGYFAGALDVAGQVDLAASGVATNVRGTLNVAENATMSAKLDVGALSLNADGYAYIQHLQMPAIGDGYDAVNRAYVDGYVADLLLQINAASDSSFSDFTAAESLALGNPVFINSSSKAAKADADFEAKSWVIGVAKAAASAEGAVEIIRDGVCTGALTGLSFAAADQIWLAPGGGLVNAKPTASGARLILVGFAKSANDLFVDIRDYGRNV